MKKYQVQPVHKYYTQISQMFFNLISERCESLKVFTSSGENWILFIPTDRKFAVLGLGKQCFLGFWAMRHISSVLFVEEKRSGSHSLFCTLYFYHDLVSWNLFKMTFFFFFFSFSWCFLQTPWEAFDLLLRGEVGKLFSPCPSSWNILGQIFMWQESAFGLVCLTFCKAIW